MRPAVRLLLAAVVVTALAAGAVAVFEPLNDDPPPEREEPFVATPLEGFETATLTVPRAGFCESVDPRQVEAALGTEPVEVQGYDNGEVVTLADGVEDVAHEFGCLWLAPDQSEARAWVFAPPVDAERAARLVREAGREQGCETSPGPPFGSPSVGVVCTDEGGGRASYQGLFGDAWLTCELTLTPDAVGAGTVGLLGRTGAWCVGVARRRPGRPRA